ncbi:MAG: hypothetical protein GX300_00455 [Tissierellia bacterium]|nr:hypothetical protein [Tissierellia bacterium]
MIFEHFLEIIVPYIAGALEAVGVFIIALAGIKGIYLLKIILILVMKK